MLKFAKLSRTSAALAVLLTMLLTHGAIAADQPAPSGPVSLLQAITMALKYSPTLDAAHHQLTGAKAVKEAARTGYLPTLSATYSYARLNEGVNMTIPGVGTFPMADENSYALEAVFEQPIFTGFRVTALYTIAKLGVGVAELQVDLARLNVVLAVNTAYFQYLASQKDLVTAKQSVDLLKSQLKTTQDFHQVGIVPVNDVLKVKVELARAIQVNTVAGNAVALRRSRLNTLLGLSVNAPLEVVDILKTRPVNITLAQATTRAKDQRPELKAMRLQLEQADWGITEAQSGYYPKIGLQGAYQWYGTQADLGGRGANPSDSWQIVAAARWTFWEWGRTYHGVSKARADKRSLGANLRNLSDQVVLEVKDSYLRLRNAEETITTSRAAVAAAQENYRITQERYKEQLTTNTELLDAQSLLTRAQNDLTTALTAFNVAQASLVRAMGMGLPPKANK